MTNKEALSKETREGSEHEVVKNTKESLQSLKDDIEWIVRCTSWQDLINRIPNSKSPDKKIYQVMLGSNRMEFYGNGRVNTISPDKTSRMASWEKKNTTIYINGRAVDLEKGKYIWKDKETNIYMQRLAETYIQAFREKNPAVDVNDGWLRDRFYNMCKNQNKTEYKIRDLSVDKPWKIAQIATTLVNNVDYAKGEVPHYTGWTVYVDTKKEWSFFNDFISEISHHLNQDAWLTFNVSYGVDLIKSWFDQKELYHKAGSREYYAHSVSEKIIESYLMLDEKWKGTKNESFETVRNAYWDAYTQLYLLNDEYNLDLDVSLSVFKSPYETIKDTQRLTRFVDKLKKNVLSIKDGWSMQRTKVKQLVIAYPMYSEKELDEKIQDAIERTNRFADLAKRKS